MTINKGKLFDNDTEATKIESPYASKKDMLAVGKMRILVVLGEGGHTKELLALVDMIDEDYQYGYVIIHDDEISEDYDHWLMQDIHRQHGFIGV